MNDTAAHRPSASFMWRHPAHVLALGFGSGLSPWAPGTAGTLWAWLAYAVGSRWLGEAGWAWALGIGFAVGWWACLLTARHLNISDPGCIVWDEVLAFWLVLWFLGPVATWVEQGLAFALFRVLDAAKPGPVGWADKAFKPAPGQAMDARGAFGILFDDLVAAGLTLLALTFWRLAWT